MGKLKEFYERHETGILYGIATCEVLAIGLIGYGLGHKAGVKHVYKNFDNFLKLVSRLPDDEGIVFPSQENDIFIIGGNQLKKGFNDSVAEELAKQLAEAAKED